MAGAVGSQLAKGPVGSCMSRIGLVQVGHTCVQYFDDVCVCSFAVSSMVVPRQSLWKLKPPGEPWSRFVCTRLTYFVFDVWRPSR